ncbi:hypothetical protein EMMF5_004281 [Cystobasidiomycetes sp. EMM_F5]
MFNPYQQSSMAYPLSAGHPGSAAQSGWPNMGPHPAQYGHPLPPHMSAGHPSRVPYGHHQAYARELQLHADPGYPYTPPHTAVNASHPHHRAQMAIMPASMGPYGSGMQAGKGIMTPYAQSHSFGGYPAATSSRMGQIEPMHPISAPAFRTTFPHRGRVLSRNLDNDNDSHFSLAPGQDGVRGVADGESEAYAARAEEAYARGSIPYPLLHHGQSSYPAVGSMQGYGQSEMTGKHAEDVEIEQEINIKMNIKRKHAGMMRANGREEVYMGNR